MIEVICPACGKRARASEEHAGRIAVCPQCRAKFAIVDPTGAQDPLAFLSEAVDAPLSPSVVGDRQPNVRDVPAGACSDPLAFLTEPKTMPVPPSIDPPEECSTCRLTATSPAGAVSRQLLPAFIAHLHLKECEEIFFFQQSSSLCMELAGFFKPSFHVAITSERVIAVARDKHGKVARREFPIDKILNACVEKGLITDDLKLQIGEHRENAVKYSFVNNSFERQHLVAAMEYIRMQAGGFQENLTTPKAPLSRDVRASYVSGPFDVKSGLSGCLTLGPDDLVFGVDRSLLSFELREVFRIPYAAMNAVKMETAEHVGTLRTLGALALAGPLAAAFVGLGLKKKDHLLMVEFRDETGMNVVAVFAQVPGGADMATAAGRLLSRRREALTRSATAGPNPPPSSTAWSHAASNQSQGRGGELASPGEIAATLEKLASLREKGVLTDDEFRSKKSELLARM